MKPFTVALVGNPNCGKTTLFNGLTGSRQKVGNWAGVTVDKKVGQLNLPDVDADLVDLPGIYALKSPAQLESTAISLDEQVTDTYLAGRSADLIINIVDACNLQRSLSLSHQLLTSGCPVIIAVNMLDVAEQQGIHVDTQALQASLKVPVIAVVASRRQGLQDLLSAANGRLLTLQSSSPCSTETAIVEQGQAAPVMDLLQRFAWAAEHSQTSLGENSKNQFRRSLTDTIDSVVLHRWLGIPIFLLVMYLIFILAINLGAVFIDFFDILLGEVLVNGLGQLLSGMHSPEWLTTLLADGIGGGIQLVSTFIPVIAALYLCLNILEDSGYMVRAAFVIDRLMSGIGLPGSAFVPLIVGFGCNVPAVMASRSLNREQDRLLTVAMAPFMSCGARLTVYSLFTAAFFAEHASLVVFALYLLGICVAVFTGWIFRRSLFRGEAAAAYEEMPHYHLPLMRNILTTTWHRLSGFIKRAGTTIVVVATLLTLVNSIGTDGSFGKQNTQDSLLSYAGKALSPALAPIGIEEENWPATVGIFTGIFAKEAVVGTLDALYQQSANTELADGDRNFNFSTTLTRAFSSITDNAFNLVRGLSDPLGLAVIHEDSDSQGFSHQGFSAMQQRFTNNYSAFCYLVLILLYTPCLAVIGAMKRESGSLWAAVVIGWSSFLGYWLASVLYQLGNIASQPSFAIPWLLGAALSMLLAIKGLKILGKSANTLPTNIIARSR